MLVQNTATYRASASGAAICLLLMPKSSAWPAVLQREDDGLYVVIAETQDQALAEATKHFGVLVSVPGLLQ